MQWAQRTADEVLECCPGQEPRFHAVVPLRGGRLGGGRRTGSGGRRAARRDSAADRAGVAAAPFAGDAPDPGNLVDPPLGGKRRQRRVSSSTTWSLTPSTERRSPCRRPPGRPRTDGGEDHGHSRLYGRCWRSALICGLPWVRSLTRAPLRGLPATSSLAGAADIGTPCHDRR